jgi:signal peptidase I
MSDGQMMDEPGIRDTERSEPDGESDQQPGPRNEQADAQDQQTVPPGGQPAPQGRQPASRKKKFSRELLIIIVAAVVLTVLVKVFVIQVYEIPSQSMENTLLPGDRVLVNKIIYHFRDIARGDIIVFSGAGSWGNLEGEPIPPPPSNPVARFFDDTLSDIGLRSDTTYYIKRVIGLPGDHVACCTHGLVTVNGVPLHETSYLYPGSAPSTITFSVTVPPGRLWVMGDNRDDSLDSRAHMVGFPDQGTIPENEVSGRAFLIIWPPSRFGDLPIPATFQQAALHAGATGAAILQVSSAAIGAGPAGWIGAAAIPLVLWRWRRSGRGTKNSRPGAAG